MAAKCTPRVLFFGTPSFAAEVLDYLLDSGVHVVGVVSKPDKAKGRSRTPVPTPVKEVAIRRGLLLLQPVRVSAADYTTVLQEFHADLFVVVAYGEILKEHLLTMPTLACINLHASLLPMYRGAAPIQRSLFDGATTSGVTIIHMVKQMDAGDIIAKVEVTVSETMTYGDLSSLLCSVGKKLLRSVIDETAAGIAPRYPQDDSAATYAPKVELDECQLLWQRPARELHNLIRGANPEPGAWCYVLLRGERKRLRILTSRYLPTTYDAAPGTIVAENPSLIVACKDGSLLELLTLQLEGRRPMSSGELLRGTGLFHLEGPQGS